MLEHNPPPPTLAQRALELKRLNLPGARIDWQGGRMFRYRFSISPGRYGRLYDCVLQVLSGKERPKMFVVRPDLIDLAGGVRPEHLYDQDGPGFLLCLWWPKNHEWHPRHKLVDTYIPWTAEWLWYYEEWLKHGQWLAGGAHPVHLPRRWGRGTFREISSAVESAAKMVYCDKAGLNPVATT